MRLRCPARKCPIEVPDDLVGARIRCPHCGELIIVDAQDGEGRSDIQPGLPPGAPDPREVKNLENQIYDGLPPLSVMLELRRRKGGPAYDQEELNRRYPMTEDDWKALAAFEQALFAAEALSMASWIGLAALGGNLLLWYGILGLARWETTEPPSPLRLLGVVASALAIPAGIIFLRAGAARLSRITLGALLGAVPWCALALSALFGATAVWYSVRMFSGGTDDLLGGFAGVCVTADAIAFLASFVAAVRAWIALRKLRPPEIAHRLIEALKYLA